MIPRYVTIGNVLRAMVRTKFSKANDCHYVVREVGNLYEYGIVW